MSNNPIQQNAPAGQHWATLTQPKLATAQSRILELTKRLDKLRPGGDDIAVASGYTAKMVKKIKETNASVVLLHKQCDEAVERLRENLTDAEALFEAKGMASRIGAINLDEEVAQGQAMADSILAYLVQRRPHAIALLRSFGDACPPQLAQALENAEFSIPDSQPMSDVLRLAENVPRLREENVALREQVEELQGELKARDDLLATANEALEQQKADFHNTELGLKESTARERQQRAEAQGKFEQAKRAIDGLFKKIAQLDNEIQVAEVQCQTAKEKCQTAEEECQTAQAKCQSQEAEFANTESRLKESIAKQKRKTTEVQVQLGRSKATVKELGGQLQNARESCQLHEADMGKLRREILARENEKKLLQRGHQSVVEENNAIKRDLKATRVALANSQDQADAKAGQLKAALGIAEFSLNKAKEECKSQENELKKMAQSRGSWVEKAKRLQDQLIITKESSQSQEEEMVRLRDALRDSGKELQDAKEWRKAAEGRLKETSLALNDANSGRVSADKRSMQLNKTLTSVSRDLEVERSRCKDQTKEISLLREASTASAKQKRQLEAQLEKSRSNLRQFLVGHEDSEWARLLTDGLLQHDGQMLVEKSSWQPGWTVLAPWTAGYREEAGPRDLDTLILRLIILLRQGAWNDKFAAYHTFCELETALLESSVDATSAWTGNAIFAIVSRALEVHRPAFMVRLMGWRILWLLHRRWADVGDESLFEAHADDPVQALCQDYGANLIDTMSANMLLVDQFVLFHPVNEQGVVVIDHGQRSLRWVEFKMIRVTLTEVVLSPPEGTSGSLIRFGLKATELRWAYNHLV